MDTVVFSVIPTLILLLGFGARTWYQVYSWSAYNLRYRYRLQVTLRGQEYSSVDTVASGRYIRPLTQVANIIEPRNFVLRIIDSRTNETVWTRGGRSGDSPVRVSETE